MRTLTVRLEGISPYSPSKPVPEKPTDEKPDAYDARTWKLHAHVRADGLVFVPPMALKNCLLDTADLLGEKIKGKGATTYSKFYKTGILVLDGPLIEPNVHRDEMVGQSYFLNADGRRNGGTRVWRKFPEFENWSITATFHVLVGEIDNDHFERYLAQAGRLIGLGRFRPRNGGYFGRFQIVEGSAKWTET